MSEESKTFDKFELATAILLGLGAIAVAWSGFQAGLWGGKMTESYSASSKMATEAAALNNDMLVEMAHDQAIDVEAKKLIAEGRDSENDVERSRDFELASYLYLYQMSDDAYKSLGLPEDVLKKSQEKPEEGKEPEEVVVPEDALLDAFYTDLDEAYYDKKFAEVTEMFDDADKKFEEGRHANDTGDKFDLAGVIFAISLFFAGIGLVVKTSIRWGLYGMGSILFLVGLIYMLTLPLA